jgi:chromate transporter
MTYSYLIYEFFKTGLLAIGGGLATIPFLREISAKYDWFTENELMDMIAVSESTPGPLGVNMATYAGINSAGVLGGIIAALSLVLPSVIIILIISRFMNRFSENAVAVGAFRILRPTAVGLIAGAVVSIFMLTLLHTETLQIRTLPMILYVILTALCFMSEYIPIMKKLRLHPIVFIIIGGVLGVVFGERLG